ncbi:MAG TPA: DUF342 domain-containing protein [Firmicutes bacterium]|jgi:uncharacterized protein (DUF342 family)|nr:DUF342 domain-containing protein [Bacillota bacterium]
MELGHGDDASGLVWVEDGEIEVTDPGPGGRPASIRPAAGVEILVSGSKVTGETAVLQSSEIVVKPRDESPVSFHKIQITKDRMKAYLLLDLRDGISYRLKDSKPSPALQLEVESRTIPAELDLSQVIDSVKRSGIKVGLDVEACRRACAEKLVEPVLIAKGRPSVEGKDGKIEFLIPLEKVIDLPLDKMQVDFRDSVKIPDVKAGQAVAAKTLAVPGLPGQDVTGKAVQPGKPKDPLFKAGKGVLLKQEGDVLLAVAAISGCPKFNDTSGIIEVDEIFFHRGDVDLASGNIKASGSIEISGNVAEGTRVECEGSQEISGTVTGGNLKAWGSITIRGNVFKSEVSAGKDSQWIYKWSNLLGVVEDRLTGIFEVEAQNKRLVEEFMPPSEDEVEGIVPKLHDAGVLFENFRQLLLALGIFYREDLSSLPEEITKRILGTLDKIAESRGSVFEKTRVIEEDVVQMRTWIDYELSKGESDVILPYVQSSVITASRDIVITGQGALYSDLSAGRAVRVLGSPGIVRGGEISAVELIHVNHAGSQGSAATVMRVSEKGKIVAGRIYPNTTLILGRIKVRTENTLESAKAHMKNGRLVILSSSGAIEVDS